MSTVKSVTKISAIGSLVIAAALTLAGPASAAGAGGHDRTRSLPNVESSVIIAVAGSSAHSGTVGGDMAR